MTCIGSSGPLSKCWHTLMMSTSLPHPTGLHCSNRRLEELIWQRARLRLNASKTRVWNAAGVLPTAVLQLAPESQVWVGDLALSPEQRGLVALGVPIGSSAFIESHLQQSLARQTGPPGHTRHSDQLAAPLVLCCATSAVCAPVSPARSHKSLRCRARSRSIRLP